MDFHFQTLATPLTSIREKSQINTSVNKDYVRGGVDKINNLSLLLSPAKNRDSLQMVSATFARKKTVGQTWIQRVQKGSNYVADPMEVKKMMTLAKGESMMTKDSSIASFSKNLNFNPSNATLALTQLTQNPSMRNISSPMSMQLMQPKQQIASTPQPSSNIFSLPEIKPSERKNLEAKNFDRIYV